METSTQISLTNNNHKRYGFLSLMSMVVGILIGSGIFVKNQILYNKSESTLAIIIAWFLVSFVVICIAYAFLEIVSSTKKTKKTGSLNVWARDFISPQAGKVIGFFFMFIYFPTLLSILAIFFGTQIMQGISTVSAYQYTDWNYYLITSAFAVIILGIVFWITTYTSKTSKAAQVSATGLSLIPLFVVIFSVTIIAMIPANTAVTASSYSDIFNPMSEINSGLWVDGVIGGELKSGWSIFKLIIISTPGIMFTLDAFIWAAALDNETKKKSTLNWALFSGVGFTIVVYILLTLSIFAAAGANGAEFTVTATLAGLFPSAANWLPFTIQLFVLLAIFTSISGLYTVSIRNVTSLSETNTLLDEEGKLFRRNEKGIAEHASKYAFLATMIMFFALRMLDAIAFATVISNGNTGVDAIGYSYLATGFASDVIMIGSFTTYALLLGAGLRNRKTKKVDVNKTKGFVPLSIISISIVFMILVVFVISTLSPEYTNINGQITWTVYAINIIIISSWVIMLTVIYFVNEARTKNMPKHIIKDKENYFRQYSTLEAWEDIQHKVIPLALTTSEKKAAYHTEMYMLDLDIKEQVKVLKTQELKLKYQENKKKKQQFINTNSQKK